MLDIKFVRTNPDAVKENIKKKFQDEKLELVDKVIALDKEYREAKGRGDELRAQRNSVSKEIGALMAKGQKEEAEKTKEKEQEEETDTACDENLLKILSSLKKNDIIDGNGFSIKEGETSPPKRYNSGSMILAMENAGQLIEDEELRAQIKGSGIGTSATRAEILKKLVNNKYLALNKKTQIITPTLMGEMIYDVVDSSMKSLLDPALTASWEKGLTGVADGSITEEEYMEKLKGFVIRRTDYVKKLNNQGYLYQKFDQAAGYYKK